MHTIIFYGLNIFIMMVLDIILLTVQALYQALLYLQLGHQTKRYKSPALKEKDFKKVKIVVQLMTGLLIALYFIPMILNNKEHQVDEILMNGLNLVIVLTIFIDIKQPKTLEYLLQ